MASSERIPVLLTAAEKGRIVKMSKADSLSMGEFLRRAAATFRPSEDDKMLEGMITQMASAQASAAIDDALEFVEASNKRIARMERKAA